MTGLSTTLPQNLRALMEEGRVDQALAELSHCEIGAREPDRGITALHITPCPDELVRRLVERGEDINAADPARRATHWGKKYNAITYALRGGENYRLQSCSRSSIGR